jgi:hypothetical protein
MARVPYFASVLPHVVRMEPGLAEVRVPKWFMVSNIQVMQPTSTERTVTMNTYDRRRVVGSRKHNRIMKTVLAAVVTLLAAAALGAPPAHADPDPNPPPIIPTPGGRGYRLRRRGPRSAVSSR